MCLDTDSFEVAGAMAEMTRLLVESWQDLGDRDFEPLAIQYWSPLEKNEFEN